MDKNLKKNAFNNAFFFICGILQQLLNLIHSRKNEKNRAEKQLSALFFKNLKSFF